MRKSSVLNSGLLLTFRARINGFKFRYPIRILDLKSVHIVRYMLLHAMNQQIIKPSMNLIHNNHIDATNKLTCAQPSS
jgi:hypothetical protein